DVPRGRGAGQFLLGDSLLAAPVLKKGAVRRGVWLPPGNWIDWYSGTVHRGTQDLAVEAPLGRTPLYLRAGAALFLAEPRRNAEETLRAPLALELTVPPEGAIGGGSLFLDSGESADGSRFLLDAVVERLHGGLHLRLNRVAETYTPAQRELDLRLPVGHRRLTVDGVRADVHVQSLAAEGRDVSVAVARIPLSAREVLVY
ncbi:MAG TPA: hypothetical protein VMT50_10395, partial [Steroidobacteraceae bacterium]|nr:hypothetical protein [Steroidobacteraceae bacterium]